MLIMLLFIFYILYKSQGPEYPTSTKDAAKCAEIAAVWNYYLWSYSVATQLCTFYWHPTPFQVLLNGFCYSKEYKFVTYLIKFNM